MTEGSVPTLHPSLQNLGATHRRRLRWLGLLFFMVMAGTLVFLMSNALTRGDLGSLVLLVVSGGMMLVALAVIGALLWHHDRRLSERLHVADRLLRQCRPQEVRLIPVRPNTRAGILVELHALDSTGARAGSVDALIYPAFRWSLLPPHEIAVQVYCVELKPGNDVVALQSGGVPLLGKVIDRNAFVRQILLSRLAMLAVLGAVLAGILIFEGVGW
jgi:hypothetical protein